MVMMRRISSQNDGELFVQILQVYLPTGVDPDPAKADIQILTQNRVIYRQAILA